MHPIVAGLQVAYGYLVNRSVSYGGYPRRINAMINNPVIGRDRQAVIDRRSAENRGRLGARYPVLGRMSVRKMVVTHKGKRGRI